jgi:hypothetical protein
MYKDSPNNGSVRRQQTSFKENIHLKMASHGPKQVESEWKEIIIKNFVTIDGHYNKFLGENLFGRCRG